MQIEKLQNANGKITKCKWKNYKKKKIKKALKPKDFFNFLFPWITGEFPWITGKFPQKKYEKKLKNFFGGRVGKTEPQV